MVLAVFESPLPLRYLPAGDGRLRRRAEVPGSAGGEGRAGAADRGGCRTAIRPRWRSGSPSSAADSRRRSPCATSAGATRTSATSSTRPMPGRGWRPAASAGKTWPGGRSGRRGVGGQRPGAGERPGPPVQALGVRPPLEGERLRRSPSATSASRSAMRRAAARSIERRRHQRPGGFDREVAPPAFDLEVPAAQPGRLVGDDDEAMTLTEAHELTHKLTHRAQRRARSVASAVDGGSLASTAHGAAGTPGAGRGPEPGPGRVRCVQCRWPLDVADDATCVRCRVRYYVREDGTVGRWPDRWGLPG